MCSATDYIKEEAAKLLAKDDLAALLACRGYYTCNVIASSCIWQNPPEHLNVHFMLETLGVRYAQTLYDNCPKAVRPSHLETNFINQFIETNWYLGIFDKTIQEVRVEMRTAWLTYLANLE